MGISVSKIVTEKKKKSENHTATESGCESCLKWNNRYTIQEMFYYK